LALSQGEDVKEKFTEGEDYDFYIISLEPKEHRLGLSVKPVKVESEKSKVESTTTGDEIKKTNKEIAKTDPETSGLGTEETSSEDNKTKKTTLTKATEDKQKNKKDE
ncbi:MAG: hypothetical protein WC323_03730, partial [Patescibacteria group bacterium]